MDNNRLYVGNLSFQASEDELRGLFGAHGTVTSVSLVTDRDTGRSRGFAFVEMESPAGAASAIKSLNESDLNGRRLQVSIAKPREERGRGDARGQKRSRW